MLRDYFKTALQFLLPKRYLTQFAGWVANTRIPLIKNPCITWFIRRHGVDMQEAQEENPRHYACFNDFFTRHLKPECRPLAQADIVSPVDGYVSELGKINQGRCLQAKGHCYTVAELLACDDALSASFTHGHFITLYLSPKDYHRIHMPIEATLKTMVYLPGRLFSVQPATVRTVHQLFARNERLVALFDTPIGLMAMVLVGAVIVGAIGTRWSGDIQRFRQKHLFQLDKMPANLQVQQGEEMGYFKLGSTVVLLFANDQPAFQWQKDLYAGKAIRYGDALGWCGRSEPTS